MQNLGIELLVLLGIKRHLAEKVVTRLGAVLEAITDPSQRSAEVAVALAELKDGKLPTILNITEETK